MGEYSIKIAQKSNAKGILDIYAPFVESTTISFELEVPTIQEMEKRIENTLPKYPWLVCVHKNKVVGYAYAGQHRKRIAYQWSTEVSVYVHEGFRKKKIATALYQTLLNVLKHQGFINIYAGIADGNPTSVAFHKNFGFKFFARYENVGYKFKKWCYTEWYSISFLKNNEPPKDLIPIPLIEKNVWNEIIDEAIKMIRP